MLWAELCPPKIYMLNFWLPIWLYLGIGPKGGTSSKVIGWGSDLIGIDSIPQRRDTIMFACFFPLHMHSPRKAKRGHRVKVPVCRLGIGVSLKTNPAGTLVQPHNCEKINFCCLSHTVVCGILRHSNLINALK